MKNVRRRPRRWVALQKGKRFAHMRLCDLWGLWARLCPPACYWRIPWFFRGGMGRDGGRSAACCLELVFWTTYEGPRVHARVPWPVPSHIKSLYEDGTYHASGPHRDTGEVASYPSLALRRPSVAPPRSPPVGWRRTTLPTLHLHSLTTIPHLSRPPLTHANNSVVLAAPPAGS